MSLTKKCSTCFTEQPLTNFHKDSNRPDGRRSSCKTCRSLKNSRGQFQEAQVLQTPTDQIERDSLAKVLTLQILALKYEPEFWRIYDEEASRLGIEARWHEIGVPKRSVAESDNLPKTAKQKALVRLAQAHSSEFKQIYWHEKDKLDLNHKWETTS